MTDEAGIPLTISIPIAVFATLWIGEMLALGYTLIQARGTQVAWGTIAVIAMAVTSAVLAAIATQHWPEDSLHRLTTGGMFLISGVAWGGMVALVSISDARHPAHSLMRGAWQQREKMAGVGLATMTLIAIGLCNEAYDWHHYHRISLVLAAPVGIICALAIRSLDHSSKNQTPPQENRPA